MLIFNYESNHCIIPLPEINILRTKATILASKDAFGSEFYLMEIQEKLPSIFAPYYVGWTNSKEKPNPSTGAMIHHPRGDIKKISEFSKIKTELLNNRFWFISEFDFGGVEIGSSGSPLFDSQKKCIGHSSSAKTSNDFCKNEKNEARFGKFDESWDGFSSIDEQLKHWLNPNGSDDEFIGSISGYEPCRESYFFEDAEDLHTSENVNGMPGSTGLLPGTRSYNGVYSASSNISTGQGVTILSNTSVEFQANTIVLGEGLTIEPESNFVAHHKPCTIPCDNEDNNGIGEERRAATSGKNSKEELVEYIKFKENPKLFPEVFPNPTNNSFVLRNDNKQREIKIYSTKGKLLFIGNLLPNQNLSVSTLEFGKGLFIIHSLTESGAVNTQKLIVQ